MIVIRFVFVLVCILILIRCSVFKTNLEQQKVNTSFSLMIEINDDKYSAFGLPISSELQNTDNLYFCLKNEENLIDTIRENIYLDLNLLEDKVFFTYRDKMQKIIGQFEKPNFKHIDYQKSLDLVHLTVSELRPLESHKLIRVGKWEFLNISGNKTVINYNTSIFEPKDICE